MLGRMATVVMKCPQNSTTMIRPDTGSIRTLLDFFSPTSPWKAWACFRVRKFLVRCLPSESRYTILYRTPLDPSFR